MSRFPCPHLAGEVDLTEERERHIAERHPDLLPEHRHRIAETLADPDQIRKSIRFGSARLFARWYTDLRQGKHVVVVVLANASRVRATGSSRHIWPERWRERGSNGSELDV